MPYLIAAVLAGIVLVGEQHWEQRLWFRFEASAWWVLRVIIEAVFAVLLATALLHVPDLPHNVVVVGVVAGIGGPRGFGRVPITVKEVNLSPFNRAYDRLTKKLDKLIDESSAEAQRVYVQEVIRPAAREGKLRPAELAEALRQHLAGRHLLDEVDRTRGLNFINEIQDDDIPDDKKVGTFVLRAWQIGAYGALQDQLKPLGRRRYGAKLTARAVWAKFVSIPKRARIAWSPPEESDEEA